MRNRSVVASWFMVLAMLGAVVFGGVFFPSATAAEGQGGDPAGDASAALLERAITSARAQRRWFERLVGALAERGGGAGGRGEPAADEMRALLEKVLPPPAAFTRRVEARRGDEDFLLVERFDPALPPAERWRLVERRPAGDADGGGPRHQGADGTFGMYVWMVSALSAEGARFLGRDETGRPRWRLARVPPALLGEKTRRFAEHLVAEATIETRRDEPYVAELRLVIDRPFRTRGIARVRRFESRFVFVPLPGRPEIRVPKEIETDVAISILLFGTGRTRTRVSYEDYALRSPGSGDITSPPPAPTDAGP